MALNPSAVPGTIINLSPFIWADRLLGHEVRNHARNPRVSVTPVTKTGVLLGRSPAGTTPASVVPAGMLFRDPDMSTDMRLLAALEEAAVSEESKPVAMGWAAHSADGVWYPRLQLQRTLPYLPSLLAAGW